MLDERTISNIRWQDLEFFIEEKEYLVERVPIQDYCEHLQNLADYYKYHNEIPRFFARDLYELYFEYQDQKRKINFDKVTKKL